MKSRDISQQFIELHTAQSDTLFRYCFFRVSDRDIALDITQDSFMRLWNTMVKTSIGGSHEHIKNPKALLFKIASNLIIDWYRKKKTVSLDAYLDGDTEEYPFQFYDTSHEQIEIQSEGKLILKHLATLDATYQHVVYLRFVEDMPPKDIAEITGLSVNVVSVRINRGLQELRKKYGL